MGTDEWGRTGRDGDGWVGYRSASFDVPSSTAMQALGKWCGVATCTMISMRRSTSRPRICSGPSDATTSLLGTDAKCSWPWCVTWSIISPARCRGSRFRSCVCLCECARARVCVRTHACARALVRLRACGCTEAHACVSVCVCACARSRLYAKKKEFCA